MLFTDCKSLFDNLAKDGSVQDDKWVAVPVASLRGALSAGPGRNTSKSEARWVPSRWQLADCLTKKGLAATFRERMSLGTTRLHELSMQAVRRKSQKKKSFSANHCATDVGTELSLFVSMSDTTQVLWTPNRSMMLFKRKAKGCRNYATK